MKLTIEHMVCPRCVDAVSSLFRELEIPVESVELGEVVTEEELSGTAIETVRQKLEEKGFTLVQDRVSRLIGKVNVELLAYLELIENERQPPKLSEFLSGRLHYNYAYLSKLYSTEKGRTIEEQLIRLRIERVKELLEARNRTLSEIAWMLNYSSVQYLSNQFRKITGETVTDYLKRDKSDRSGYDGV